MNLDDQAELLTAIGMAHALGHRAAQIAAIPSHLKSRDVGRRLLRIQRDAAKVTIALQARLPDEPEPEIKPVVMP